MSMSDPIADMLTRIRNAHTAGMDVIDDVRYSKMKVEIARILKKEGYITDYVVEGGTKKTIRVYLKYAVDREPVIKGLKRISRPGIRRYVAKDEVPKVLGGLGIAIVSTSQGVMTASEAKHTGIGGEVLCHIW